MKQLAEGVHQLDGFPRNAINVYLIGDVLVDAATRHATRRILRQVRGHRIAAHALTHAHPDHQGASRAVCETLAVPLWCGERDADAMESGDVVAGSSAVNRVIRWAWPGPPHPVARRLKEGDTVAGFTVLDTPGHSAGHVSYWRESDRTLICGDVYFNLNMFTGVPGLHEPPGMFTPDPRRNRDAMRRLADLEPQLVCFGHGPPLRDPAKLKQFAARVPR